MTRDLSLFGRRDSDGEVRPKSTSIYSQAPDLRTIGSLWLQARTLCERAGDSGCLTVTLIWASLSLPS